MVSVLVKGDDGLGGDKDDNNKREEQKLKKELSHSKNGLKYHTQYKICTLLNKNKKTKRGK